MDMCETTASEKDLMALSVFTQAYWIALSEAKLAEMILDMVEDKEGEDLLDLRCARLEASVVAVRSRCSEDWRRLERVVEALGMVKGSPEKYFKKPDDYFDIFEAQEFPSPPRERKAEWDAWWNKRPTSP